MTELKSVIARKFGTTRALHYSSFVSIPVAWIMLAFASLLIIIVPFRRIARTLGDMRSGDAAIPIISQSDARRVEHIGHAIAIAAKYAPFRADCLPQALVAALACRAFSIPFALHLGVKLGCADPVKPMAAHAWVQSGPVVMTGGRGSFSEYKTVACFVSGTGNEG